MKGRDMSHLLDTARAAVTYPAQWAVIGLGLGLLAMLLAMGTAFLIAFIRWGNPGGNS
jgi:hypothetical protein